MGNNISKVNEEDDLMGISLDHSVSMDDQRSSNNSKE
jgi:hypothetical protein